jgi:hypothetical protein
VCAYELYVHIQINSSVDELACMPVEVLYKGPSIGLFDTIVGLF